LRQTASEPAKVSAEEINDLLKMLEMPKPAVRNHANHSHPVIGMPKDELGKPYQNVGRDVNG